jgi:hypothetical protein
MTPHRAAYIARKPRGSSVSATPRIALQTAWTFRIRTRRPLPENSVDLPYPRIARLPDCPKTAWIFRIRTNQHQKYQRLIKTKICKKCRVARKEIRKRDTKLHEHGTTAPACCCMSKHRDRTNNHCCDHHPRFERRRLTAKREREGHRQTYHHTAPGGRASQEHR